MKLVQLVATVLALSLTPVSTFAQALQIRVNGIEVELKNGLITKDGNSFVEMYEFLWSLGAQVDYNSEKGSILARRSDHELSMKIGSRVAIVQSKPQLITNLPYESQGKVWVPLRFAAESLGCIVTWDSDANEIVVDAERIPTYSETPITASQSVPEIELPSESEVDEDAIILTLDEAVERAVEMSSELKSLNESIELIKENQANMEEDFEYYYSVGDDTTIRTMRRALLEMSQNLENINLRKEIMPVQYESMIKRILKTIEDAKLDIKLIQHNIEVAKVNIKNLQIKVNLGMAVANDVKLAEQNLEQSLININSLEILINEQKILMNDLLGFGAEDNVVVDYKFVWEQVDFDVEAAVESIPKQPTILIKSATVTTTQYNLETTGTTIAEVNKANQAASAGMGIIRPESRLEKESAYTAAVRDLADAKTAMEKAIRTSYNSLLQLETGQKNLELELKKAQDNYEIAQINLNVGMITPYEVLLAKLAIAKVENDIAKNILNAEILRSSLQTPYLLTAQ